MSQADLTADDRLALDTESSEERRELVARMGRDLPAQGDWTEDNYLDLVDVGAELDHGFLEFKPVPNEFHDFLVRLLTRSLEDVVGFRNVHSESYRIELWAEKFRSPDVIASISREGWQHRKATAADLVIEVVSENPSDRQRDLVEKRAEYERAGIPEYWIVDPRDKQIVVLVLEDGAYREHGVFGVGAVATSVMLPEFQVDVTQAFKKAGVIE